jgi:hypothetical protein
MSAHRLLQVLIQLRQEILRVEAFLIRPDQDREVAVNDSFSSPGEDSGERPRLPYPHAGATRR